MLQLDPEPNWIVWLFIGAFCCVVVWEFWPYIICAVIVIGLVKGVLLVFTFTDQVKVNSATLSPIRLFQKTLYQPLPILHFLFRFGNYFFNKFSIITCKGYLPNGFFIINSFISRTNIETGGEELYVPFINRKPVDISAPLLHKRST